MFDHHIHFSGAIPLKTIVKLLDCNISEETLRERIIITKPVSFENFLQRFHVFDYINWDERKLHYAFKSVVDEIEKNPCLSGASLICSVDKYPLKQEHIFDLFNDVKLQSTKNIKLILGIKYEKCNEFINNYDSYKECFKFIDGVNFISREDQIKKKIVEMVIDKLKSEGLSVGMHVGEMGGDENVQFAIDVGANIISHGTLAKEDTVKKALDNGMCVDVSFISNILTSVIKNPSEHAFFNYINETNVRLVSDDPVIFDNDLNKEIQTYAHAIS
jgi:hypothetical protein